MDGKDLPYTHGALGYGVTNFLTVGVSSEFPITPDSGESPVAAFDATVLPIGEMTLSGSIAPGRLLFVSYCDPQFFKNCQY